ncbi:hypothetical protein AD953_00655 [Acetobacter malorum]|uniref:Uncharacterized protein n=1 Tax=Acetobacter malorum TaxID=178901 RepID=A0A149VJ17_9PROT|nr:hypothetical protein AD953_00655 [Acetobacter malorum]
MLQEEGQTPNHAVPVPLGKLRQKMQAAETRDSLTLSRQLSHKRDIPTLVSGLDANLLQSGGYSLCLRDNGFSAGDIAVEIIRCQAASTADGREELYRSVGPVPPSWHKKSSSSELTTRKN